MYEKASDMCCTGTPVVMASGQENLKALLQSTGEELMELNAQLRNTYNGLAGAKNGDIADCNTEKDPGCILEEALMLRRCAESALKTAAKIKELLF